MIQGVGGGFASRIAEVYSKANYLEKQMFISTANTDNIFEHLGQLMPPRPAIESEGYVVFFGQIGATLEAGIKVSDGDNEYRVLDRIEIFGKRVVGQVRVTDRFAYIRSNIIQPSGFGYLDGVETYVSSDGFNLKFLAGDLESGSSIDLHFYESELIRIEALTAGASHNKDFDIELSLESTQAGVNSNCRVISLSGGRDEENVNDYRQRGLEFLANPQAPFSISNILATVRENVKTLKNIWVKGGDFQIGNINVYALNSNNNLTDREREDIKEAVEIIRPAVFPINNLLIHAPTIHNFQIRITNLMPNNLEPLEEEIRKNIKTFFENKDLFEKGFNYEKLKCEIYNTTFELVGVESFDMDLPVVSTALGHYNNYVGVKFG